ncbi:MULTISPECIES: hypothetical protein [Paraburkholderia]|uniref:Uncharacterized protein n=1 Tax=Paraburkholderia madseniana TaxID=2599607 RepID=A0AAP5ER44_9BURK|nr:MULTISPECIES: hypothetical protein [Paraburkholderia]MCX4149850.1 hypothetical protein [Paraburkholderia madseniana]MDN7152786.1 hypothetical protein [Paraburkholderia sp. WS6]MDQ6411668.1 hypothetical protein [Paraburkholderia madseniana]
MTVVPEKQPSRGSEYVTPLHALSHHRAEFGHEAALDAPTKIVNNMRNAVAECDELKFPSFADVT